MAIQRYTQIMVVDSQANLPATAQQGDFAYCMNTALSFFYDGTQWQVSTKVVVKKTSAIVNAKTTGAISLYTLESSSLNFYPTMIVPRSSNISGVVTPPTISIGSNASSYNNIASSGLLSTVLSTIGAGSGVPQQTTFSPALAGGVSIFANVTISAVATNYSVIYDILGFYDT